MCKKALIVSKLEEDKILKEVISMLENESCHTIILYGSRAKGNETELSDYDLIAIRGYGENSHENRLICGFYIDLFIYNESNIDIDSSFLRIREGIILKEKDDLGQNILNRVEEIFVTGPQAPTKAHIEFQRAWALKMIERIDNKEGVESNYRRVELLYTLLEQYFVLRKEWYLGAKESFSWLRKRDSNSYECFEKALNPLASISDIKQLVERVLFNLN